MNRQVNIKALVSHIVKGDGVDKCRICLGDTSEGRVFLGDTVMMLGDKAVTLSELLETVTGVEVLVEDDLPNCVCATCSDSALGAGEFRKLCQRATDKWRCSINLLETVNGYKFDINTKKLYAIITDDNCIAFEEHKLIERLNSAPILLTKQKDFLRKRYLQKLHCQCPNCGKNFTYAQDLYKHLKASSDSKRACYVCASIMQRDDLVQHLIEIHNKKLYDCKKCPALLFTSEKYKVHMHTAHKKGACTCGECGLNFKSSHGYRAHLSVHIPKTCPKCSKHFRNQICYFYHVKQCCNLDKNRRDLHQTKRKCTVLVNLKDKQVKVGLRGSTVTECICDYCDKKFSRKKFLVAHIQIVHLRNTHRPCVYCGKLLASAHMTMHLKRHEQTESFKCEHCSVVLKSKLGYSQHLRIHTGEKPYVCKFCDESFSASSRRSEHVRKVHKSSEETLKHSCQYCSAKFRVPSRLKKHMLAVHSKKSPDVYKCGDCSINFVSCRALVMHHRENHKE